MDDVIPISNNDAMLKKSKKKANKSNKRRKPQNTKKIPLPKQANNDISESGDSDSETDESSYDEESEYETPKEVIKMKRIPQPKRRLRPEAVKFHTKMNRNLRPSKRQKTQQIEEPFYLDIEDDENDEKSPKKFAFVRKIMASKITLIIIIIVLLFTNIYTLIRYFKVRPKIDDNLLVDMPPNSLPNY